MAWSLIKKGNGPLLYFNSSSLKEKIKISFRAKVRACDSFNSINVFFLPVCKRHIIIEWNTDFLGLYCNCVLSFVPLACAGSPVEIVPGNVTFPLTNPTRHMRACST